MYLGKVTVFQNALRSFKRNNRLGLPCNLLTSQVFPFPNRNVNAWLDNSFFFLSIIPLKQVSNK